jgi:hypothetical protein
MSSSRSSAAVVAFPLPKHRPAKADIRRRHQHPQGSSTHRESVGRLVDHVQVLVALSPTAIQHLEHTALDLRQRVEADAELRARFAQSEQPGLRFARERASAIAACQQAGARRCAKWLEAHPRMVVSA